MHCLHFFINYITEKPRPDGLALAFQECKPGQSHHEAVIKAWLGLAYLGLAWPGSRPQAGPCTALRLLVAKGLQAITALKNYWSVKPANVPTTQLLEVNRKSCLVVYLELPVLHLVNTGSTRYTTNHASCIHALIISIDYARVSVNMQFSGDLEPMSRNPNNKRKPIKVA